MPTDLYTTLGVARDASAEAIRSAYRKLAKQHHPDLNPGNKTAEERFKAVASAYDILGDAEKRARYDRGEIDATGEARPERPSWRGFAEGERGARYRQSARPGGAAAEEDFGDLFEDLFANARGSGGTTPRRGGDATYSLAVEFLEAIRGATRRVTLPDGKTMDVRVPPGVDEGQTLRLKGQGHPGRNGAPAGDALIELHINPHRFYRRDGRDIHVELPVSLSEAVLGAKVEVPTPTGAVAMTIPKRSDTGRVLRLRGRGIPAHAGQPAGDLYVTLKVTLADADQALEDFLRDWSTKHSFDPRRGMMEES